MPISVHILTNHGLVYVRNTGLLDVKEQSTSFQKYTEHPDFAPGQNLLVNMCGVTGFDGDIVGGMKHFADMAQRIPKTEASVMLVYVADSDSTVKLSQIAVNSLKATDRFVTCVTASEQDALEILGLPEDTLNALDHITAPEGATK